MKAGQRAEAGGPGGPRAKVQDDTEAPKRMLDSGSEVPGEPGFGRSPIQSIRIGLDERPCVDDKEMVCDCVSDEMSSCAAARTEFGTNIFLVSQRTVGAARVGNVGR